jgi:hypothetical protein
LFFGREQPPKEEVKGDIRYQLAQVETVVLGVAGGVK